MGWGLVIRKWDASADCLTWATGRVRGRLRIVASLPEEEVVARARADARVGSHLAGREVRKTIYLPGKLLNLVVR